MCCPSLGKKEEKRKEKREKRKKRKRRKRREKREKAHEVLAYAILKGTAKDESKKKK